MIRPQSIAIMMLLILGGTPVRAVALEPPRAKVLADWEQAFLDGERLHGLKRVSEALAKFEESNRLHPHPQTMYNIGICRYALGQYLRAFLAFNEAIEQHSRGPSKLDPDVPAAIGRKLPDVERVIARVPISVVPGDVEMTVDGRPLLESRRNHEPLQGLGGVAEPGKGKPVPAPTFELVVDAGPHLLAITRTGYQPYVRNEIWTGGLQTPLNLNLEEMDATVSVSGNVRGAVVKIDGKIEGEIDPDKPKEVKIEHPRGRSHSIEVTNPNFEPMKQTLLLEPGQKAPIEANLKKTPATKKWWFWTAAVGGPVSVVGIAVGIGVAASSPKDYDPGNTGWVAMPISQ